jgi:TP901 family phage tail tape measure protein
MSDVNANIKVSIDSSQALSELKSLQRQISLFHTNIAKSSAQAALAQRTLQTDLLNAINATGRFSAEMRTIKTSTEAFTNSLEKNKFSIRQYFRYAAGSTRTFGKLFRTEFDTISQVAEDRVKKMQTQYIKMGRDAKGAMQAMAITPKQLNMSDYATKMQIAAQKQQLFNQLLKQGSTNLLNFGKNTQWAGRQLMVGFTLPLAMLGSTASKAFMDMETAALKFRKVYGDLLTPKEETQAALDGINALANSYTKYGIAASQTVSLAADAAAAGFKGIDLQAQTEQATRLSVLGQIDQQKALETTIALQNAFQISSQDLADSINFLNSVENQTVLSLDDVTTAIPIAAPIVKSLGGDVKDLAFFMTAMKEGGINAAEGANALKSGLASIINPSKKASDMLATVGINIRGIVEKNKGDLRATVLGIADALNTLRPLDRARAIEQLFGKFQFSRISTLFANIVNEGTQASRVLDLTQMSMSDLATTADKELGITADSAMNKFKKTVEDLKVSLIPVGQAFLEAITPILESVNNILSKFKDMSSGSKRAITILITVIGGLGPILLMTFGLLANGLANILKLFGMLRGGYLKLGGQSTVLGEQTQYLTSEQIDAAAVASSLDQTHARLTQTFNVERVAIDQLKNAYIQATGAALKFAVNNPGLMSTPKKYAKGIAIVPGSGNKDNVPSLLTPGEAVVPAPMVKKYGPLINGMIADNIPGFAKGKRAKGFWTQDKIETLLNEVGATGEERLRIPLPVTSPAYSVSGVMAPRNINRGGGIGMTKEYLQSPLGKDAQLASIQVGLEQFGVSTTRATEVLDKIGPVLDIAVGEFDDTIQGWKVAAEKATKTIEGMSDLSAVEKKALRQRLAPTDVADYPVTSEKVLELKRAKDGKRAKATPRSERKDADKLYGTTRMQQILAAKGHSREKISEFDFAHMPGYEKIEGQDRPRVRKPDVGVGQDRRELSGTALFAAERGRMTHLNNQGMGQSQILQVGRKDAESYSSGVKQGGLQDMYIESRERKSPHPLASQDGRDDAQAYQKAKSSRLLTYGTTGPVSAIDKSIRRNNDRRLKDLSANMSVTGGMLGAYGLGGASTEQDKQVKQSTRNLKGMNSALMSGTFALTSMAAMGSMAGGKIGDLSQQVMKYSGLLFGLMSVTQLLTQASAMELLTKRKGIAASAIETAVGRGGLASKSGIVGSLSRVTVGLTKFIGPIGLAATAATLLYLGNKKINSLQEEQRQKYEALSDAVVTTKDQLKSLGDYFGITAAQTPLERNKLVTPRSQQAQTELDKFKQSDTFKTLIPTINAVKKLNNTQAATALNAKGVELIGQGFSKEQVKLMIQAIQEEAGKNSIKLDFKDVSVNITKLASDISTGLGKFKDGKMWTEALWGTGKAGKKARADFKSQGSIITSYVNGLSGMFANGTISGKQFDAMFENLSTTMKKMPNTQNQLMLVDAALKQMGSETAKAALGLGNVGDKMLVLKAAAIGVTTITPAMIAALKAAEEFADGGAQRAASRVRGRIAKDTKLTQDAILSSVKEMQKALGETTIPNAGDKNALQLLKDKTKEIQAQTTAFKELRKQGINAALAEEMAGNVDLVKILEKTKYLGNNWKNAVAAIKDYGKKQKELEKTIAVGGGAGEYQQYLFKKAEAFISLQEHLIDMQYKDQLKSIDVQTKALGDQLDNVKLQEDQINEKFDKQIGALNTIKTLNENIANQEKQRLTIADALSRGDISAAAVAIQEARSQQASASMEAAQQGLTTGKENAIASLGAKQIQLQIDALNKQKTVIEDTITKQKESIKYFGMTADQIRDAAKALDLANEAGVNINNATFLNNILKAATGDSSALKTVMVDLQTEARNLFAELQNLRNVFLTTGGGAGGVGAGPDGAPGDDKGSGVVANSGTTKTTSTTVTAKSGQTLSSIAKANKTTVSAILAANPKFTQDSKYKGGNTIFSGTTVKIPGKMYGGIVAGNGMLDKVPTMLTPGEFVVNKNAAKRFGPLLTSINESKYPGSMSPMSSSNVMGISSNSINNNSTSVYNYSLKVDASGSSASPNEIARIVMSQIKNMDAQRIRGNRY